MRIFLLFGFMLCLAWLIVQCYMIDCLSTKITKEIKESRHREDLLYQEEKNLAYITDVLTQYVKK